MTGTFRFAGDAPPRARPDFNVFNRYAANFPWRSHAVWFLTQMLRWGQLAETQNLRRVAEKVYRPELYREVAASLGMPFGSADYKTEGRHGSAWSPAGGDEAWVLGSDLFFDGLEFSPTHPAAYLAGFQVHNRTVDLDALRAANPGWFEEDRLRLVASDSVEAPLIGEAG